MDESFERVNCPLCACPDQRCAYDFTPFEVVRCARCKFYFLSPRLLEEEMQKAYRAETYFEGADGKRSAYQSYRSQGLSLRLTFRELVRQIRRLAPTARRFLEVGCGYGYLLEEAAPFFDRMVGTDYSQGALEEVGVKQAELVLGGAEELAPGDQFDVIVATHVLEHTYRPLQFVETLGRHLAPGGTVILATPNMDSPIRWLLQKRWPSFKVPEHTLYFNEASLTRTMALSGLAELTAIPYPHAFPLSLIFSKFGLTAPAWLGRKVVWIPTSTVAVAGRKGDECGGS